MFYQEKLENMSCPEKLLLVLFLLLTVTTNVTQNGPITCQACLQSSGTYCLGRITADKYLATIIQTIIKLK